MNSTASLIHGDSAQKAAKSAKGSFALEEAPRGGAAGFNGAFVPRAEDPC